MIAPVPAPISNTGALAASTRDAISSESLGELGATAPIDFGLSSIERKKSKCAGFAIDLTFQSRMRRRKFLWGNDHGRR